MTETPDREEAIRKLIRQTIASMGDVEADRLPHLIRERLKGQVSGEVDLNRYLKDLAAEWERAAQPKK